MEDFNNEIVQKTEYRNRCYILPNVITSGNIYYYNKYAGQHL